MEFFKPGRVFDFMGSAGLLDPAELHPGRRLDRPLASIPGPNYGTDFRGGTEVEIAFRKPIDAAGVRKAVEAAGFPTPDVVQVVDPNNPYHFLIRVQDVSAITDEREGRAQRGALLRRGRAGARSTIRSSARRTRAPPR